MAKKVVLIVVGLALVAGAYAWWQWRGPVPAAQAEGATVAVRRGALVELASATGTVEPDVFVEIKPRASGEVTAVFVSEGQAVHAGDILLQLDPTEREESLREAEVALAQAEAKQREAEATLAVARAELTEAQTFAAVRQRGAADGLLSAEERRIADNAVRVKAANVTLRAAQRDAAAAATAAARLRVTTATRLLAEMTVRAPIDATVLTITVERGSVVSSGITNIGGGTPIMTLADLSNLLVIGKLDEAQIGRVREGQPVSVRVDAYPDRAFRGEVQRISPLGEALNNVVTFDIEVSVRDEAAHLLRSGMSADLEVVTARHEDALLLPVAALRSRDRERFVILPSGEWASVTTGATDGTDIVVVEGLVEGQRVSTDAASGPRPGGPRPGGPFGMPGPGRRRM